MVFVLLKPLQKIWVKIMKNCRRCQVSKRLIQVSTPTPLPELILSKAPILEMLRCDLSSLPLPVVDTDPRVAPLHVESPIYPVHERERFPDDHASPGQGLPRSYVHQPGCSLPSLDVSGFSLDLLWKFWIFYSLTDSY
jgi:hypothetical protein